MKRLVRAGFFLWDYVFVCSLLCLSVAILFRLKLEQLLTGEPPALSEVIYEIFCRIRERGKRRYKDGYRDQ